MAKDWTFLRAGCPVANNIGMGEFSSNPHVICDYRGAQPHALRHRHDVAFGRVDGHGHPLMRLQYMSQPTLRPSPTLYPDK